MTKRIEKRFTTKNKPTKNAALNSRRKWVFLTPPSKLPKKTKELQRLDDTLSTELGYRTTLVPNSINSSNYDSLLYELSGVITGDSISSHEWDLYSKFINDCYESKSTSCYVSMRTIFKEDVIITANLLYNIFEEVYRDLGKKVYKDPLMFVSCWTAKHLHRMVRNKHYGLRYHRSKELYTKIAKENKDSERDLRTPTAAMLSRCFDGLVERGYGINFIGFKNKNFDKSKMSLFIPSNKLLDLVDTKGSIVDDKVERQLSCYVEIRDKDKNVLGIELYKKEWFVDTKKSEDILKRHSLLLKESKITLDKAYLPDINLLRIHNDGDINLGGRLFDDGTWTTMKKSNRKRIIVNGNPVVTLDLKYLHPSLLYHKEGINIEGFNPYGGIKLQLDNKIIRKYKKFYGIESYDPLRSVAKLALLILINSDDERKATQALERKIARDFAKGGTVYEDDMQFIGLPRSCAKEVISQVKQHNKKIVKYFCTGVAKELMRTDSDIILETLDTLTDKKICALPLHDSVTVEDTKVFEAEEAIKNAYEKVVGDLVNFKLDIE